MPERLRPAYFSMIAMTIALIAVALTLGQSALKALFNTDGTRLLLVASGLLFPLIWLSCVAMAITTRKVERPTAALWRLIKRQRWWLLRGASFVFMIFLTARSYSSFKSSISRLNPFWADPWLAKLDHMTFGADPWRLTHALIGPTGTLVLDRIYLLWFPMMFLILGWFCFTRNPKLQIRGLMCFLLSWGVLGCGVAVAFASVGPCFYSQFVGDDRFMPLMASLAATNKETELVSLQSMNFLIDYLGVDRFGSGISAMPSLHVAVAALSFLAVYSYSPSKILKIFFGLYALCILIGSVHLGWHYAWDGIVSIIAVTFFWWATGRYVDWLDSRDQVRDAAARLALA